MNWQPIETAPKDGTPILACVAGANYWPDKVEWSKRVNNWVYPCGEHGPSVPLTHWIPLELTMFTILSPLTKDTNHEPAPAHQPDR